MRVRVNDLHQMRVVVRHDAQAMQEAHGIGFVHETCRVFRYKGLELVDQLFARDVVWLLVHDYTRCGGDVKKCRDNDQSQRAVLGPRKPWLFVRVGVRVRVRVRVG